MDIRGVAFDANGTLVRILTEDGMEEIFRAAAHFLTYQGIDLCRNQVRELYFAIMAEQQQASREEHPEFDAVGIWRRVIAEHQTAFTRALPAAKLKQMPLFLAEMCRGISRRRLGLYPHAREVLDSRGRPTVDSEGQGGAAGASGDRLWPDDVEDVPRELVRAPQ